VVDELQPAVKPAQAREELEAFRPEVFAADKRCGSLLVIR
jgi:hypothetical protein